MKNKTLAYLSGSLIIAIVTIWAIMQHAQEIGNFWAYARWGLLFAAVLSILYLSSVQGMPPCSKDRSERRTP
ncbi:hypothetical protein [Dictyobacter arantiisoli]|uniref:Uncharacterized protein n=1 Tax=Dictyobacter arantiisoli TaxID=2014874 RepID=A0A5A5TK09_9CHLR|nr:hypothetical protein [Dictyobacter arantiisoli]GCF11777.1 hypothetical protein KDI_53410 [Dictyobacter arantiisoli]